MLGALSIGFIFLVLLIALGVVDENGIRMLEESDRANRLKRKNEQRERERQRFAEMFPNKPPVPPPLTDQQTQAFHAATPDQRAAYYKALISGDAAAAHEAGAKFGFSPDWIAHEAESDHVKGMRQQLEAQKQAEFQQRYDRLMATNTLTPGQAAFAAGLELPKREQGPTGNPL